MAADVPPSDRFADAIAELRNVCTASFGLAFYLATRHDKDMVPTLERELERFRKLVDELVAIHRRDEPR